MLVSMLIENLKCPADDALVSEYGLSIHIRKDDKNILFDSGASDKFMKNAKKMKIDLQEIDAVVISHGHHDHIGGLKKFLYENSTAKVYLSPNTKKPHYKKYIIKTRNIGIDPSIFSEYEDRFIFVDSEREIFPGIHILTKFSDKYPRPKFNEIYFEKNNGKLAPDTFDHELLMVIKLENNMVLFSGCSHVGILNMIEAAKKKFPNTPIKSVIGGLHLVGIPILKEESENNIKELGREMLSMKIGTTYTCHCTSRRGYRILKEEMDGKIAYFFTGLQLEF